MLEKFGCISVVSKSHKVITKGGHSILHYNCVCDCGNTTTVIGQSLRLKGNHNCGCYRNLDKIKDVDMIGKRFGRLVVTSRISPKYSSNNTKIHRWKCICDCGNTFNAVGTQLLNGHIKSCGCGSRPYFEDFFINYFNENEICFEYQKQFDDLIGVGGGKLSYDFFVHFDNFHFLLELQGGQHFKPVEYFGGFDKFTKQLAHDKLKFNYAVKHNLPLLCIKTDNRTDFSVLSEFNNFIQSFTKKESSV